MAQANRQMPTPSDPPVIPPQQKRFAWQIVGVVLLPLVVLPLVFGVFRDREVFSFLFLYTMLALIMLCLAVIWYRHDVESIRAMPRGGDGGAFGVLLMGLLFGYIGVMLAWHAWPDDILRVPKAQMQQVRGEIPAEPHVVGKGRYSREYLKIGDVLLSCDYVRDDDCRAIRRHAGRVAEISWHPNHKGYNVVFETRIDGRLFRSHEDVVRHYRASRERILMLGLAVLLLVTLPCLWLWRRTKAMMRKADPRDGSS